MAYLIAPTDDKIALWIRDFLVSYPRRSSLISFERPLVLGVLMAPPEPTVLYFSRTFRIAPPAEQQPGSGGTHAHGHA